MQVTTYGSLCSQLIDLSPTFRANGSVSSKSVLDPFLTMSVLYDIWRFLITFASNGYSTPSISSSRISDEGSADSPIADLVSRRRSAKGSRISKSPATPRVHRSPRNARHGRIPRQCHEFINQATQQRCPNFEGYQGIIVDECESRNTGNHGGHDPFNVCSPCRTRVSRNRSSVLNPAILQFRS